jgi:RNA polymerase sigma-70 factor (ECF subfamily)
LREDDKKAFVGDLAREHGQRLRRFLAVRLRQAGTDVPDLMQEVYLRLLRVPSTESIRSPRAYLFTVALHVLYQHKLKLSAEPEALDVAEVAAELEAPSAENPATRTEIMEALEGFERVLSKLPPAQYVTFVLHRQYGYSREEIAARLGISLPLVKKHLARALAHCRRSFAELE